mgnify:CR=1 FL=1
MGGDSDAESIEGCVDPESSAADWGKAKHDYYYTDYVDKDYPNKLTAKEERLAAIEQEEALRIQRKLLTTLEDTDFDIAIDNENDSHADNLENLIDLIETRNKFIAEARTVCAKRKRVAFEEQNESEDAGPDEEADERNDRAKEDKPHEELKVAKEERQRRPINMAIKKNRGLTPYKKKEYRNPRVKHKLKYKKAMVKRRRNVCEAQKELHRYSGEATGIKTSTIKSIKLC